MRSNAVTILEQRRRASDREKRQLSIVLTLGWALLTVVMLSLVLVMDYRRFEAAFFQLSRHIEDYIARHIKGNEMVLEGFTSFIAGMGHFDETRARPYADRIIRRFPHVFQLEVAEAVTAADLPKLTERQRKAGYPNFTVKAFDYDGSRQWRELPASKYHYPLIFMHPMPPESRPVLGLDVGAHEHLVKPLKRAIATGSYQTSLPFKLVEGDDAYVMFMPVPLDVQREPGPALIPRARYIALIVLRTTRLFREVERLLPETAGLLICHTDKSPDDPAGHLYSRPLPDSGLMPKLTYRRSLEQGRPGFTMTLEQRFGLDDVSFDILSLILGTSLMIFLSIRLFILRRYLRDMERTKREARLELLAKYDSLTSLPNRNLLLEWLQESLSDVNADSPVALLYLDLDNFKQVNDLYGHSMGDQVLRTVADRIHGSLRKGDFAVRLGGDEFVVLIMYFETSDDVTGVIDKLQRSIEAPMKIDGHAISVRVSIGVSFYPESTEDPHQLIEIADRVMYQVKRSRGRRLG